MLSESKETEPTDSEEERSPLRWRVVLGVIIAAAMTIMDLTMTSAALGDIQSGVDTSLERGALLISAYVTAELVTLVLSAYLTRVLHPRTYLLLLVSAFVIGSVMSANAWSFETLLVSRVVQGAASGAIMPFAYYLIVVLMAGREFPKAISVFSLIITTSGVLGPILCMTLVPSFGWRAIYYVCVPIAVLALWLALPGLTHDCVPKPKGSRKVSLLSVAAVVVGLCCAQYVLDVGNSRHWFASPVITAGTVIAVAMLVLVVVSELRTRHPLVELGLFRNVAFSLSCGFNVVVGAMVFASYFLLPYYMTTLGFSVGKIGQVLLVGGVAQVLMSLSLPILLRRFNVYVVSAAGAAIFAVSALVLLLAGHDPGDTPVIGSMTARAVGGSLVLASLGLMATQSLTSAGASSGSMLFNLSRSLGGSIGAAACAAFVVLRQGHHSAAGQSAGTATAMALQDTFVVVLVILGTLSAVLVGMHVHRRGRASARA